MEFDWRPLWISLNTALTATSIAFFLGILTARSMLSYQGKAKPFIEGLLISPLVLPPTVVGFLLLWLFGRNGLIGELSPTLSTKIIFSWPATAIAATVVAFPLMYKTALGAFTQIDRDLLCAARTLGASEWTVFWRVILPLAWPGIIAGTILAFARSLGEFGATLMLAGNIPGKTQTIPIAIYMAVEVGDMTAALVWVLIILLISLTVLTTVNSWSGQAGANSRRMFNHWHPWPNFLLVQPIRNPQRCQNDYYRDYYRQIRYATIRVWRRYRQRSNLTKADWVNATDRSLFVDLEKQLPGFSLDIQLKAKQETLGILGASGSGKSMTLRCLAGLETPTQGVIRLNGRVLFDAERGINLPTRDRRIGFLFQNYALFPHLTVWENIAFGVKQRHRVKGDRLVREKISQMHLDGLEHRYPHQLSGGQQQRVALARALAIEPELLLLDEPFSALDTYLRSQLEKQLIETLANYSGVTLFITHNLEEAYRVCRNLLILSSGRAIGYGTKQEIFHRPQSYTVAKLTGCKNFSQASPLTPRTTKNHSLASPGQINIYSSVPPFRRGVRGG
jgi:molybdate ABC transporter permease protein